MGGLPKNTVAESLTSYFEQFGEVVNAYLIIDPKTKRSKSTLEHF